MIVISARTKFKARRLKRKLITDIPFKIQYWFLRNIIQNDVIEEFCQDTDLMDDYYYEPRD